MRAMFSQCLWKRLLTGAPPVGNVLVSWSRRNSSILATIGTSSLTAPVTDPSEYRVEESNPAKHTLDDVGKFYQIPRRDFRMYFEGDLPRPVRTKFRGVGDSSIMIRRPGLEAIHYLKTAHPQGPSPKIVLWGKDGGGKFFTHLHVNHFAHSNGWFLFDIMFPADFFRRVINEIVPSEFMDGCFDMPYIGSKILLHIKIQNEELLSKILVKEDHEWSKREMTPKGVSLLELVNHGIARAKHSNMVLQALIQELKKASNAGECRCLVSVAGGNGIFLGRTVWKIRHTTMYRKAEDFTLSHVIAEAVKGDFNGGGVLFSLHLGAMYPDDRPEQVTPLTMVGREAFHVVDPFIPIEVPAYSPREFRNALDYYREVRWIDSPEARSKEGGLELEFLTGRWPQELWNRTKWL
ncbi:unnamed protein product [Cyprideis torosa]|uniref:Small ribosomal subunit protein mS29 n=1 Tax=Cyprideis torosa TaxID=163714 RepID=A0A7R8W3A7_9CRUS|nr:unnamed protein product [Cyprideis torosa]CAG0882845.1 unnamed protein product [Cyprideis torosa]